MSLFFSLAPAHSVIHEQHLTTGEKVEVRGKSSAPHPGPRILNTSPQTRLQKFSKVTDVRSRLRSTEASSPVSATLMTDRPALESSDFDRNPRLQNHLRIDPRSRDSRRDLQIRPKPCVRRGVSFLIRVFQVACQTPGSDGKLPHRIRLTSGSETCHRYAGPAGAF